MRDSPRNVRVACEHAGLTHFGGAFFFHEFIRVLQLRNFLAAISSILDRITATIFL